MSDFDLAPLLTELFGGGQHTWGNHGLCVDSPTSQTVHQPANNGLTTAFAHELQSNVLLSLLRGLTPPLPTHRNVGDITNLLPHFEATFLERSVGDISQSIGHIMTPAGGAGVLELVKFAVYLASNNMLSETQTDQLLSWIVTNKYHNILRSFLEVDSPTTKAFANAILLGAIRTGDAGLVQLLVNTGLDFQRHRHSAEPIELAGLRGNIEIVRILIAGGILDGISCALDNAIWMGNMKMATLLLEFSQAGGRHLSTAVQCNDDEMVRILLANGVDPNIYPPHSTNTILHSAVSTGRVEIVKSLLEAGANIHLANSGHKNEILEIAVKSRDQEMVRLLRQWGAEGPIPNADPAKDHFEDHFEDAIREGDSETVQHFLLVRSAIDKDYLERRLQDAIDYGNSRVVELLLGAHGNVTEIRKCLLHRAIYSADMDDLDSDISYEQRVEVFKILLAAGTCIEEVYCPGVWFYSRTPIQAAAESYMLELVHILVENGAEVNAPPECDTGLTALEAAVTERGDRNLELIRFLIEAGADINPSVCCNPPRMTLLEIAIKSHRDPYDQLDLIQLLLDFGAYTSDPAGHCHGSAMETAAKCGELSIMRLLLKHGGDPNTKAACKGGRTPLQSAAEVPDIEMVKLLLSAGAQVNAPMACGGGKTTLQAALASLGASQNLELLFLLLDAGAHINSTGYCCGSGTALQDAAEHGNLKAVQILLERGADVNTKPYQDGGKTALQAAAGSTAGNIGIVQVLLDAGANVNAAAAYESGFTALQGSAMRGHIGITMKLLEHGANVNARGSSENGRTALEGAAENGRLDTVQLLLNAGADSSKPEEQRYLSAIDYAEKNGYSPVSSILKSYRKTGSWRYRG